MHFDDYCRGFDFDDYSKLNKKEIGKNHFILSPLCSPKASAFNQLNFCQTETKNPRKRRVAERN